MSVFQIGKKAVLEFGSIWILSHELRIEIYFHEIWLVFDGISCI